MAKISIRDLNENSSVTDMQDAFDEILHELELSAEELAKLSGGAKRRHALHALMDLNRFNTFKSLAVNLNNLDRNSLRTLGQ